MRYDGGGGGSYERNGLLGPPHDRVPGWRLWFAPDLYCHILPDGAVPQHPVTVLDLSHLVDGDLCGASDLLLPGEKGDGEEFGKE